MGSGIEAPRHTSFTFPFGRHISMKCRAYFKHKSGNRERKFTLIVLSKGCKHLYKYICFYNWPLCLYLVAQKMCLLLWNSLQLTFPKWRDECTFISLTKLKFIWSIWAINKSASKGSTNLKNAFDPWFICQGKEHEIILNF